MENITKEENRFNVKPHEKYESDLIFWAELQKLLDKEKLDLDLRSSADIARLMIFDVQKDETDDFVAIPHYATDPEQRTIDIGTITDQEVKDFQEPNTQNKDTLKRIKQAAIEGRLMVSGHRFGPSGIIPRPVRFGSDGLLELGPDRFHTTEESNEICNFIIKPPKPKFPGIFTYIKSFFGNRMAKRRIELYNSSYQSYQNKLIRWNAVQHMDKDYVKREHNGYVIDTYFFGSGVNNGEQLLKYSDQITKLHDEAQIDLLPEEQVITARAIHEHTYNIKALFNQNIKDKILGSTLRTGKDLDVETEQILAKMVVSLSEIQRAESFKAKGDYASFVPKTTEELNTAENELLSDKDFHSLMTKLTIEDFNELGFAVIGNQQNVGVKLKNILLSAQNKLDAVKPKTFEDLQKTSELKKVSTKKQAKTFEDLKEKSSSGHKEIDEAIKEEKEIRLPGFGNL